MVVVVFESVLNALRAYVFSHTTSRIDVELGARLFRNLVPPALGHATGRVRLSQLQNAKPGQRGQ